MSLADKFIKRVAPALSTIIGAVREVTSYLSPDDDWVEVVKRYLFLLLDPITRPLGRVLVYEKGREDYFCTAKADSDAVEKAIFPRYQRNLTSTRKFRSMDGGREWADGSFVYDPDDTEWQHHIYLFGNGDGTTDVYGHRETSAEADPYGHVTDKQIHGDPNRRVRMLLNEAEIEYV